MCMYLDKIYVSDCWTIKHSHVEFLPSPFYNFFWCKIDCKRKHLKFQQIVCIPVCKFSCIKLCTSLIFLLNVFYQYADINIFDKIPSLKNARIVFTCKKYCLHFYMSNPMTKKVTNLFCLVPLLYDIPVHVV